MTVATETIYDVFLSHGPQDRGIADLVRRSLASAGLEVFVVDKLISGDPLLSDIRRALAECSAVVLLLTRSTLNSQNTAFETGMAMAWNKPIHVLFDGIDASEIPSFLKDFRVRPVAELDAVAAEIAQSRQPLSDGDRDELAEVYREIGVPTDQLLRKPLALKKLADRFEQRTGTSIGGERLAQELIRLRKQGRLPRLERE